MGILLLNFVFAIYVPGFSVAVAVTIAVTVVAAVAISIAVAVAIAVVFAQVFSDCWVRCSFFLKIEQISQFNFSCPQGSGNANLHLSNLVITTGTRLKATAFKRR